MESAKRQKANVTFTVSDTKLPRPKPYATETRDLINISSQFVHSAASRPKQTEYLYTKCWYMKSMYLTIQPLKIP